MECACASVSVRCGRELGGASKNLMLQERNQGKMGYEASLE
jgi:hypothetical protein